jgi:hypothetical protein
MHKYLYIVLLLFPFNAFNQTFAEPGKDYGSAPLWVWHTKITRPIIDSMMQEFKQNAFGGVMVHPRPGLITEYLSKEWYELFAYTVNKGKQLGLNVWIYDENSYPTGFAGGLVPDQMPESYNQGQMLQLSKLSTAPADTTGIYIVLKENNGTFTDVTNTVARENGANGNYYIFKKAFYQKQSHMVSPPDYPYVDLMVKGVTEKFIDVTFKGYEKAAGAEFGKIIPGIFSDEPSIPSHIAGCIRWTPDLFSTFQKRWGYDLKTSLPSLFEETGDWRKVRHNFQATLLQLFIDRWSKPMYNYAQQHNLKWTGHYWEHGWPDPGEGPDNMAMYAWHQQPGIDMLFNQFNENSPNAQFGNIRSVKELGSVANQLSKQRTLSETYGGGGWELTFKDMKRLADWEYVLGVNFLNQHLSMITLTGVRKYDYPQSFSYHTPWWPYYKTLNQYYKRLSYALSQGQQQNDILIMEPTTSAWMYSFHGKPNPRMREIGNQFQAFITTLEKSQVEYDLGSENIIADHGKIENGKFVVGARKYSTVVIPPGMENIDGATYKLLKNFSGRILQYEKLQRIDGIVSNDLPANVKEFSLADFSTGITYSGGDLYHHRRQLPDGQLLFLTNASMDSTVHATIQAKGKDVLLKDLFTGETLDYTEVQTKDSVSFKANIPAAGSMLLFIANSKQTGYKKYKTAENAIVIKSTPVEVLRPAFNSLMIDFCDLQLKDTLLKDCHTFTASRIAFQKNGFNKNPWDHQMQFKERIISRDTFSAGSGFTATYRFTIAQPMDLKKIQAVVEQGTLWKKITINGKPVQPVKGKWWLDRSFAVLEIGSYVKEGENELSLFIDPMSVYAEIEPVYILGNFNVEPANKGWQLTPPKPLRVGSWKEQGYPLYAHSISYVKECNLENISGNYNVQLGKWQGTVASVKVNGVPAGIIMAEPNTLDISKYLKKGNNRIEVTVTGSLKNLLGPHHNNPKPGMVGPGHWSNVRTYPSGTAYQLYDYGLMEDFNIVKY